MLYINVGGVPGKNSEWEDVVAAPEASGAVVGGGGKVVTQGAEVHTPHWVVVPLVNNEVGEGVQAPESDSRILRAREQEPVVMAEAGGIHGAGVANEPVLLLSCVLKEGLKALNY